MINYLFRLWPPDLGSVAYYLKPLVETLLMSIAGTSLAFLTAIILSFPANRTITSSVVVYSIARVVLAVMRATPILVLGIMMVAAVGLGATAGIVGIWFHTSGVLGKYFSEILEASDKSIVDAAYIDGCNKLQAYLLVMLPMSANAILSYLLYYYEANFRQATFLGVVGAGGIGIYLTTAVGLFDYGKVCTLIILIVGTALALDVLSRQIRRRFL